MQLKTPVSIFLVLLMVVAGCVPRKTANTPSAEIKIPMDSLNKNSFLINLLHQYPEYFDTLLRQNNQWNIRIIYTQIDRKADNSPLLTNYYFNIDPIQYFYPASTVKMPTAFLALQKLNELNLPGLNKNSTMITEAAYSRQDAVYNDPNSPDGRPTIENYIKKIFLVSDNDAYNRLYEFLGQEYINSTLHKMGYDSVQILHRLDISRTEDENRHTNPVKFYDTSGNLLYQKPLVKSEMPYQPRKTFLGKGYMNGGQQINQPFDFSNKNRINLTDLHSMLQTLIFPEIFPQQSRFKLTDEEYRFLYRYMSMKPGESDFPQYDSNYNGAHSKFLMYGGKGDLAPDIRIFNKIGEAYGFLTDVAYIVDFNKKIEFFLSATIYCNSDGIFNDDHYDYENVGLPFLKNLGEVLYGYELKRKRKHVPDLSKFKTDYTN